MAKSKHRWRFDITGGSSRQTQQGTNDRQPLSVNERIEQSRKESNRAEGSKRLQQLSEVVTSKSAPQELREILQIPETAPIQPRSRRGLRRQVPLNNRTPGPRAPPSWSAASASLGSSRYATRRDQAVDNEASGTVCRFSRIAKLPLGYHTLPKEGTLLDYSLKVMARNWDWVRVAGDEEMSILPIALRSCLLSYISRYASPYMHVPASSLKILFGEDADDLARIDLTELISADLTVRHLARFLARPISTSNPPDISTLDTSPEPQNTPSPPETWDQDLDFRLSQPLLTTTFPNLTHLSLASSSKYTSWKDLLDLAPKLSTLTHLSLAHWPTPCLTPNAAKTYISTSHGSIPASGTHYYSSMRGDFEEAANILRRLSDYTYSLRWLDLEGCQDWLEALTWQRETRRTTQWNEGIKRTGPDWNGSWSQITYINITQGDIPDDYGAIISVHSGLIQCQLLNYVRETQKKQTPNVELSDWAVMENTDGRWAPWAVLGWIENEGRCRGVASEVRRRRKEGKGHFCIFDHGWEAPAGAGRMLSEFPGGSPPPVV